MEGYRSLCAAVADAGARCEAWRDARGGTAVFSLLSLARLADVYDQLFPLEEGFWYVSFPDGELDLFHPETKQVFRLFVPAVSPDAAPPAPAAGTPPAALPRFCTRCGTPNAGGRFCTRCGAAFAAKGGAG